MKRKCSVTNKGHRSRLPGCPLPPFPSTLQGTGWGTHPAPPQPGVPQGCRVRGAVCAHALGTWQGGTAVWPVLCHWHPPGSVYRHSTWGLDFPSVPRVGEGGSGLHTCPFRVVGAMHQGRVPMGTAALGTWHVTWSCNANIPLPGHNRVPPLPLPRQCPLQKELINQGPK